MLLEPIFAHAREHPQDIAITDDTGQYTFEQLAGMVSGLGMYLGMQTSRPHVGLLVPPSAGYVASFYGTLMAGKSVVPINYLLGNREIAQVVEDSEISTVVTVGPLAGRLKDLPLKIIDLLQLPRGPLAIAPKLPSPNPDDLAVLLYTSGTSGRPKGVMLTYRNLQSDADAAIQHANLQSKHRFLGILPLFHSFGMTAMMICPMQLGAPVVYMARFSALAALQAIRKHNISIIFGVPSMYAAILRLDSARPDDFAQMYAMISGGEALPQMLRIAFERKLNCTILEGYGLSETSPVISLNTPADHRPGSVGKTIPGAEVKILGPEGDVLPAGQSGEVLLRGPMIMKGYYKLPDETAAVLSADGFFRTGDLGKVDEDGYLYITGRLKDLIISAGEKVAPREIEDVLARHPAVLESAVVGRPDASRGEAAVAFVALHPGATVSPEELRRFCRDQGLVNFKIPKQVIVLPELPRSHTGKVLKRVLAEQLRQ